MVNVTVPAGATSATFDLTTLDDALADNGETIVVGLGSITGGGFEAISANPAASSVTTTINDDVTPGGPGTPGPEDTVSVSLTGPASVTEGQSASGYTVTLSQAAVTPVTVALTYSGTATDGSDYTRVVNVTVPAGATSATFDLTTLDDALADNGETIVVGLGSITGGGFEAISANPAASSVTTTINDDVTPGGPGTPGPEDTVSVSLTGPASVTEGQSASGYTVTLSQAAVTPVTVALTYSGTATDGSDYTRVVNVTVPAGATSATFDLTTLDDALADNGETIVVGLGSITGGGFEAISANPAASSVTTTINDDVTPGGPGTPGPEDTVSVSLTGPASVTEGQSASGYTVTLSQAAVTPVTVALTYSGTATDGSDYTRVVNVTVPAGATSATFDLTTLDDALADNGETIVVGLGSITGGGFEAISANPAASSVTTTINDDVTPGGPGTPGPEDTVSVSLTGPASVTEGQSASGYTVTLSQAAVTPVTVALTYSGTATDGSDYTRVVNVTVPAGATSATFDLTTLDDALADNGETIVVGLGSITGGGFEAISANPAASSVTTTINDDVTPGGPGTPGPEDTVSVSLTGPASVTEGQSASGYTVTLSQAAVTPVTVALTYSGTATDGSDYTRVVNVTVPAGATSATFDLTTLDDALADNGETIVVGLGSITGGGFEAISANPAASSVTTTINDDVTPGGPGTPGPEDTVSVSLTGPASVTEGQSASGYTVTLSQAAVTPVTVALTYSGTATDGSDYTRVVNVTVPAGATSATFDLTTLDDALADNGETIVVELGAISGGGFEAISANPAASSVTTTINDDVTPGGPGTPGPEDTVSVSLTGPASVTEGQSASGYTVTLSQAAVTPVTVALTYSGTATDGSDYTRVVNVTVPAGATSATFDLTTLDDALADNGETIVVELGAISGGGFEAISANPAASSVTTTINDDVTPGGPGTPGPEDTANLSLSGPTDITEGSTATYTLTVDKAPATDLVVSVVTNHITTNDGDLIPVSRTVTIAAGTTTATFVVTTLDDAVSDTGEQFRVLITGSTGGGYENLAVGNSTVTTTITDNDNPPVNGVPAAQSTNEDTARVFSTANNNALSVSDVDGGTLSTTVAVTNGTLTAVAFAGATITNNGSGSVTITGTAAAINGALNGLSFAPTADYNGGATLTLTTTDGTFSDTDTVAINVASIADIVADAVSTNEDTAISFNPITGTNGASADNFEGANPQITAINGTAIAVGGSVAVTNGSVSLAAGNVLTFTPAANFNGTVPVFSYTVTSGGVSETANVSVNVVAVNDPPVNGVPAAQSTNEDTARVFSTANNNALSVSDVDGGTLSTTVAVTNGTLTAVAFAGATITNNGSGSVTITGTAAAINGALNGLSFAPTADYNGGATLTLTTTDGTFSDTDTVAINVASIADIVADAVSTNEDTAISFNPITGTNGASADNFEGANPQITAINGTAIAVGGSVAVTNGSVSLAAGNVLTFTPAANFNGTVPVFSYTVTSGGVSETANVSVNVVAVNDPPVNGVPAAQSTNEDTARVFSTANNNALSVSDVDGGTLSTTVAVTNGTLTAVAFAGATITNNGSGSVTITGTAAAINGALNGLSFAPTADYNGGATLTLTTTDGTFSDTDTVAINVASIADIVADAVSTNEDTAISFNPITGTNGASADNFEGANPQITAINGTAIAVGGSVAVTNGSVSLAAGNVLTFTPAANFNGTVPVFSYTVTSGGVSETANVSVNVVAVNDPPVNGVPAAQSTNEDTTPRLQHRQQQRTVGV